MTKVAPGNNGAGLKKAGPRRIIWLNRFFYPDESATSIMLTDLVRELSATSRHDHHVVFSRANYASHEGAAALIPAIALHPVPAIGSNNNSLPLRVLNFIVFYLWASYFLIRYLRRDDLVVSLTDPPLIGVIASSVAGLKGARCVHWVQDIFPETASRLGFAKEGGLFDRLMRRFRNRSWRKAASNVVIGGNMRDYLVSHAVEEARVNVVQNWAGDDAILPVKTEDNRIRSEWSYRAEHCVIGYSGNLGRAHDIDTMIGAKNIIADQSESDIRFLYIGGGAKQTDLRAAADTLPGDLVSFRPYQPMHMLAESLSVPDIHWISLQPFLEGLIVPSKLYGALAVGRPVVFIGDPQGEIARLLKEGDCGESFAPGQSDALAEYLLQLSQDPVRRRQLGTNGRAYLESDLKRSMRLAEWEELIDAVL